MSTPSASSRTSWEPPSPEALQAALPQYEVTAFLGRGGMGAVYKGWQISLERPVAIKILSQELDEREQGFAERFKNEARAMAKLNHPGIIAVYEFGETADGLLYIVMEYVEGTDVARMIARNERLPLEHALAITTWVCDALAYAHARGIVHRDIKPANIMVSAEGAVKVADFGLAKVRGSNGETLGLTQSGMALGTLYYMAPEALMLGAAVDHRADIYAVGVMLYQMLTGKLPQGMFKLPSRLVPGLDAGFDEIIARAMREDRDTRHQSAAELRLDLDGMRNRTVTTQSVHQTSAPAVSETDETVVEENEVLLRPAVSTRKTVMAWAVAACVVLAAVFGWIKFSSNSKTYSTPTTSTGFDPATPLTTVPVPPPSAAKAINVMASQTTAPASPPTVPKVASVTPPRAFTNSLGVKFVSVPGTDVLFSIWETRVRDYAEFARSVQVGTAWTRQTSKTNMAVGREPDHPVVGVSAADAERFCLWLTSKETATGVLPPQSRYRLPTSAEWSLAVGERDNPYPWGTSYPPKENVGNYADISFHDMHPEEQWVGNYLDGFVTTAPVGSFPPNAHGLYDLGGNAWEYCEDLYEPGKTDRVTRGAAWYFNGTVTMRSSYRGRGNFETGHSGSGFRCVLVVSETATLSNAPATTVSRPSAAASNDTASKTVAAMTLPAPAPVPAAIKAASPPAATHPWKDATGRVIEAAFGGVVDDKVLLKVGDKSFVVALNKLSRESQDLAGKLEESATSAASSQLPPSYASRCSPQARLERLLQNGGSEEIEQAVTKSLAWLKTQQNADGSWGKANKAAYTGFALQCFFARCETAGSVEHGDTVMKALMFLIEVSRRNPHGLLTEKWDSRNYAGAYEHAIATTALGEACILAKGTPQMLPGLNEAFAAAVQVIIDNQNKRGAWTYGSDTSPYKNDSNGEDLSLSNWHFQALRVARDSGLKLADLDLCISQTVEYIASKQTKDGGFGGIKREAHYNQWYLSGGAIVGLQTLAPGDKNAEIRKGVDFLRSFITAEPLNWSVNCNLYSWRHYTDAFFLAGGDDWSFYRSQLMPQILGAQQTDGSFKKGTADWLASGAVDPVYRQCLCTLQLEVFYRLAPRY